MPRLRRGLFTAALVTVMKSAAETRREIRLSSGLCGEVARQMRLLGREHDLPIIPEPLHSGSGQSPLIVEGLQPEVLPAPASAVHPRQELLVSADGSAVSLHRASHRCRAVRGTNSRAPGHLPRGAVDR